jgi:hypothetical protein
MKTLPLWEVIGVPDRGYYLRLPVEGATASPYRYIGIVGDMVIPKDLLTEWEAVTIKHALNRPIEHANYVESCPPCPKCKTGKVVSGPGWSGVVCSKKCGYWYCA